MAKSNTRVIEKPSLSDWIVFLSDIVNRRQAYLGLIFTSFFSIIVLIFAVATLYTSYTSLAAFFLANNIPFEVNSVNSMIWVVCGSLLLTFGIMLTSYLYQICSKKSDYNRAVVLLKKIMKREITIVENIQKEWFGSDMVHENIESSRHNLQKKHWYEKVETRRQLLFGFIVALVVVAIDALRWVASLLIRLISQWGDLDALAIEIWSYCISFGVAVLLLLWLIKKYSDRLEKL